MKAEPGEGRASVSFMLSWREMLFIQVRGDWANLEGQLCVISGKEMPTTNGRIVNDEEEVTLMFLFT